LMSPTRGRECGSMEEQVVEKEEKSVLEEKRKRWIEENLRELDKAIDEGISWLQKLQEREDVDEPYKMNAKAVSAALSDARKDFLRWMKEANTAGEGKDEFETFARLLMAYGRLYGIVHRIFDDFKLISTHFEGGTFAIMDGFVWNFPLEIIRAITILTLDTIEHAWREGYYEDSS